MDKIVKRTTFVFYTEWFEAASELEAGDRLAFYEAVMAYAADGTMSQGLTPAAAFAFKLARARLDADREKFEEVSNKRREAANNRWSMQMHANDANACKSMQMDANACNCMQMDANACNCMQMHYENETENETENEYEYETENEVIKIEKEKKEKEKKEKDAAPLIAPARVFAGPAAVCMQEIEEKENEKENEETEKEKVIQKEKDKEEKEKVKEKEAALFNARARVFVRPTVDQVEEYCRERGNNVDAANFVDFYSAKGWVVGKSPMKDWKAAVRTWELRDRYEHPKKETWAEKQKREDEALDRKIAELNARQEEQRKRGDFGPLKL